MKPIHKKLIREYAQRMDKFARQGVKAYRQTKLEMVTDHELADYIKARNIESNGYTNYSVLNELFAMKSSHKARIWRNLLLNARYRGKESTMMMSHHSVDAWRQNEREFVKFSINIRKRSLHLCKTSYCSQSILASKHLQS